MVQPGQEPSRVSQGHSKNGIGCERFCQPSLRKQRKETLEGKHPKGLPRSTICQIHKYGAICPVCRHSTAVVRTGFSLQLSSTTRHIVYDSCLPVSSTLCIRFLDFYCLHSVGMVQPGRRTEQNQPRADGQVDKLSITYGLQYISEVQILHRREVHSLEPALCCLDALHMFLCL